MIKIDVSHAQATGVLDGGVDTTAPLGEDGSASPSTVSMAEVNSTNGVGGVTPRGARHESRYNGIDFPPRE